MEKEKFEVEKLLLVNIIKDSKQTRITIPAEIVEDFKINPERHQFAWAIQKEIDSDKIIITGRFVLKQQNVKKEN